MKKRVLFLLPLFLGACSDSGESPVITIKRLYVDVNPGDDESDRVSDKIDYANQMDKLPALKVGDKVDAILSLDGNGAELKTFTLENDEAVKTELVYQKAEVTTEGNLTDEKKGQLRFKDGVTKTQLMVKATIEQGKNGDVKLAFYLSSKAECEGAQEELGLRTTADEAE